MPPRSLVGNADDVIEIIAEYVCASVVKACVLRRAAKAWRRAVDTTLRDLVFVTSGTGLVGDSGPSDSAAAHTWFDG